MLAWRYVVAAHGVVHATNRPSRVFVWLRSVGSPACRAPGSGWRSNPARPHRGPVRTTIIGAALAIASVAAAITFAASLDHLVSTPRLYGWTWTPASTRAASTRWTRRTSCAQVEGDLQASKLVSAYSQSVISRLDVDGATVTALGIHGARGRVGPTIVVGRAPASTTRSRLGARTLDRIGASIGDVVHVQPDSGGDPVRLRVVGRVVLPGLGTYPGSDKTALGEGALLTRRSLRALGPDFGAGPFLVRLAPGATAAQLARDRAARPDRRGVGTQRPSDIVSYAWVRSTPLVLAGVLALLADRDRRPRAHHRGASSAP